jgi:cytochrome c-type biogenesis protein CcmF
MAIFVIATIFYEWFRGVLARHRTKGENFLNAFFQLFLANRPRYGGYIVHLGIMVLTIGVIGSSVYDTGKEVTLNKGESATVKGYTLTYQAVDKIETQKKLLYTTTLEVSSGGKPIGKIIPEKYFHQNHGTPVTVAAVRSTMWEDLYVVLIGWEEDGSASFKIMSNPLVNWMWLGAVILNIGGLLAFWPDRKRSLVPAPEPRER